MEEVTERHLRIYLKPNTRLSGAVAIRGFILDKGPNDISDAEIVEERVAYIGPADAQEYETSYGLPSGTFNQIWSAILADIELRGAESPVANIRHRISEAEGKPEVLFAAQDLSKLAEQIMYEKNQIKGIGRKRAAVLFAYSNAMMATVSDLG